MVWAAGATVNVQAGGGGGSAAPVCVTGMVRPATVMGPCGPPCPCWRRWSRARSPLPVPPSELAVTQAAPGAAVHAQVAAVAVTETMTVAAALSPGDCRRRDGEAARRRRLRRRCRRRRCGVGVGGSRGWGRRGWGRRRLRWRCRRRTWVTVSVTTCHRERADARRRGGVGTGHEPQVRRARRRACLR